MKRGILSHSAINSGCCSTVATVSTAPFSASFSTILRPPSKVVSRSGFEAFPVVGSASFANPTSTFLISSATPVTTLDTETFTSSLLPCNPSAFGNPAKQHQKRNSHSCDISGWGILAAGESLLSINLCGSRARYNLCRGAHCYCMSLCRVSDNH
jgi:hypothetical protein